jgi:hypothetical protein
VRITTITLRRIAKIKKEEGLPGLVKTLKVASIMIQQSVGGHRTHDLTELGKRISRTKAGLPRIILASCRKEIRAGNTIMIRYYLSLFAIFRVLIYTGDIKLKSITDPFTGSLGIIAKISKDIPLFVNLFDPH